jgi:hypothetical protein
MEYALKGMTTPMMTLALAGLLSGSSGVRLDGYTPAYDRIRAGLHRTEKASVFVVREGDHAALARKTPGQSQQRDSVWNGLLIGAGIGAAGGYIWARDICGSNDTECFFIAGPVGVLAGAGIGAAVGAVADALHR